MTTPTEHDREALAKHIEKIEAFRKEHFIPQADHPEVGSPWQQAHNETLNQCCNAAIAALTTQGGEQPDSATIENLARMLRRLIWQINKMDGDLGIKATAGKAKQLLWKYGLQGNPLRIDEQTADTVSIPKEQQDYKTLYYDLIMCVGYKWEGESRHDTAKRYIINAEKGSVGEAAAKEGK